MTTLALPGGALVERGLAELGRREETDASLLVSIAASRLVGLGYDVGEPFDEPELRLYALLATDDADADAAHSRYNALVRRLSSFVRAAECVAR